MEELKKKVDELLKEHTWVSIDHIIELLINETGKGKTLDPFKNPDRLLWNNVGVYFITSRLHLEALTIFQAFLDCYHNLQEKEHQERIHKGTPLQYLGIVHRLLGQLEQSRKYHILAFIEDVINVRGDIPQNNVLRSPAAIVLRRTFRMRDLELISLQNFTSQKLKINAKILYPEQILLDWITENEKNQEILIARSKEESLYKVNLPYLRELFKRAVEDSTGKALESLATYLFSCVDGFEPIPRLTTSAFHFDLVIRNLIKDHPLLETLGDYIGVECKNINKTVRAEQLNHFIHKLRLHNMRCGIIFTNKGISGIKYKGLVYGRAIQVKTFNRDGIVIFDITKSELDRISKGDNLLSLLLRKYEKIQFM
jgi:hypothetical protein